MTVENPLNYTNLTYEDQLNAIKSRFAANENLANLRESSEYQMLIEMISAMSDINNWNLEKRANENYFSTLKLLSSAIELANNLGYDITRAIPAESTIKLKLSGDLTAKNINSGDVLQIPIYNNFDYNSNNYLLKNTLTYTFTDDDITSISADGEDFEMFINANNLGESIKIVEGEIKDKVIEGQTNDQVGQTFQTYRLVDELFSNQYGEFDYDIPITKVSVGQDENSAIDYEIDRRSVINVKSLENFVLGDSKKVCVLKSSSDENINLLFGDGQYAALGANVSANGPSTTFDNIYIQYLSTNGSKSNVVGVINEKLTSNTSVTIGGSDITDNIEYLFVSNITGGGDIEDIESIKINAPNIYYSLDRVVSKRDYNTYLKSLTSPINIKNALSWGEQEEQKDSGNPDPIKKLFNIVLFSCVASLYNLDDTIYTVKSENNGLDTAVLDADFSEYSLTNQNYFNIYVKGNVVEQLQQYQTSADAYVIYGNEVDVDIDDFVTKYSLAPVSFQYTSDVYLIGTELRTVQDVNFATITNEDDIALALTQSFSATTDDRGDAIINSNFGQTFMPNVEVTWDSEKKRFGVAVPIFDDGFITLFSSALANEALNDLGLANTYYSKVVLEDTDDLMADNILNVIDKLDERSMVTVANVYISPMLYDMRITGKVYINQLADKDSVQVEINNAIYSWADKQADFRKNIYLSNVIEIIESFESVIHADINFEAVALDNLNTAFVNSDSIPYVAKPIYADEFDQIVTQMQDTNYGGEYYYDDTMTLTKFWGVTTGFYNSLPSSNDYHTPFRDTIDFLNVISVAYRDNVHKIQQNLLDEHGNIVNYTKGNEIVKLNNEFVLEYKTTSTR